MGSAIKLYYQSTPVVRVAIQSVGVVLDASGEKYGVVFQALEDVTITHLGLAFNTDAGTSPDYKIGLQGVGTTGLPDGTYFGGGSPASVVFNPTSLAWADNTIQWLALDNSHVASRGDHLAMVVEHSSGTIDGSNHSKFAVDNSGWLTKKPYWLIHNGTSWAKQTSWNPLFGYRTASNRYGILHRASAAKFVNTSGNRVAAKFSLPTNLGSTFKLRGFTSCMQGFAAGGSVVAGIWDASSVLQDTTVDTDYFAGTSSASENEVIFDGTLPTLSTGTTYYLGFEHAGSNFWFEAWQLGEADDLKIYAGEGQFVASTYNGSAWADDDDAIVPIRLLLEDVTAPSGGGGGLIRPVGMTGGLV